MLFLLLADVQIHLLLNVFLYEESKLIRGKIGNGDASILNDMCNRKINQINAEMVAEAAENGDRLALSVIKEAGSNLGIGLVNIIHSFDPEIIVFGGGLSASLGMMMPSIKSEISQRVMNNQKDKVKLVVSKIEENVALLGASSVFFDAMKNEKQN